MSYRAITDAEIASGKPTSTTTANKIQDNFTDHETRIQDLEAGSDVDYPPILFRVNGHYGDGFTFPLSNVLKTTANFNLRIIGARLIIDRAGTSGTTEVDLLYSRAGGAYTSVFSTKPSVLYSSGDDAVSNNAVLDTNNDDIEAGDLLRVDISSAQAEAYNFILRIDYTKTGS